MIIVNRIGESITGSVNGKRYGVSFSQEKYDAMKALEAKAATVSTMDELKAIIEEFTPLTLESYKEVIETKCPYIFVNPNSGKFFLQDKGKISTIAMPASFVDRIMKSMEKNIDILPLIKFWTRLLRNPKFTEKKAQRLCNYVAKIYVDQELKKEFLAAGLSDEVASEKATGLQTPITQEGLLCTYKVSAEIKHRYIINDKGEKERVDRYAKTTTIVNDVTGETKTEVAVPEYVEDRLFEPAVMHQNGDAFYCDSELGHLIKVGSKIWLENWEQINTDDNVSAVKGLHVGNLDYIRGFQNSGTETHNVFIDPMYVGAITDDGSGALRVKEYFVHSSFAGVNRSIYHSSKYAAMTDAAWEEMRKAAIEAHKATTKEAQEKVEAYIGTTIGA